MSATIEFFVAMKPGVKGNSKKIVRFGARSAVVASDKDRAIEESLVARLLEFRPPMPMVGPVRLDVTFVMPIPCGWAAWKARAANEGRFLPVSRPDRGNMLKLIEDTLGGAFYVDDAQVVHGLVTKVYGSIPGYRIILQQLSQATKETERSLAEVSE